MSTVKLSYIPNDASNLLTITESEVDESLSELLTNVVEQFPPQDAWSKLSSTGVGGLYCGPTGIAYLFMNLDKSKPGFEINSKPSLEWAELYLSGERPDEPPTPKLCGVFSEELSFCAVAGALRKDMSNVQRLVDHATRLAESREGFCEYCYGRAGLLYLLRLVRSWFPESADLVNPAIKLLIENILAAGPPWILEFNNVKHDFVGPGHGRMGVLVQIVLSDPTYAPQLEQLLVEILDLQANDGNWPSWWPGSEGIKDRDLVQWCHGAPGMVQSLVAIREFYPALGPRIDEAIAKGRELTWKKGLLVKEPNMCHGTTGNAFAFPPGEKRDHFLAYTTEKKVKEGNESGLLENCDYGIKWSVCLGSSGRAIGWLWKDKEKGCYLGYDDV